MSSVFSNDFEFQIWKTVMVGPGINDDFREVIIMEAGLAAISEETEFDLAKITAYEIGFKKGARRDQICARAREFGLELCPPEVGEQLEFQYDRQCDDMSKDKSILIAMEPIYLAHIHGYAGHYVVFFLVDESTDPYAKVCLFRKFINPGHIWAPDDEWVFVRPRKEERH